MDKHYHIVTYGCQMNVHDSERIAGMLSELGYTACDDMEGADIVVFNTCCIREMPKITPMAISACSKSSRLPAAI